MPAIGKKIFLHLDVSLVAQAGNRPVDRLRAAPKMLGKLALRLACPTLVNGPKGNIAKQALLHRGEMLALILRRRFCLQYHGVPFCLVRLLSVFTSTAISSTLLPNVRLRSKTCDVIRQRSSVSNVLHGKLPRQSGQPSGIMSCMMSVRQGEFPKMRRISGFT